MYLSARRARLCLPAKIVHTRLQKIFFSFYENGYFSGYCRFFILKMFVILSSYFAF